MVKSIFILILIFLSIHFCYSQDVIDLEKIIITPYKAGVSDEQGAVDVDVIDAEQAQEEGNYNLISALGDNASTIVVKAGGLGGNTSVFLRGNASYHTRFLLDGVKLYDPLLTQAYYNPAHFYLNGIEKVEISKGQQCSLYGSDAIGGVISMVTKKATQPFAFSYLQEIGHYNTATEQMDLEFIKGNLATSFSVLRLDSEGFSSTSEAEGNREKDPYHNMNVSLRTDYDFNENLSVGLVNRLVYAKYEYDGSDPNTWEPSDDDDRVGYNYEGVSTMFINHQIADILSHKFQYAYTKNYRKYFDDSSATVGGWYDSKTYQLEWKWNYQPFDFYKIIAGADYAREKGDSRTATSDFPKNSVNTNGLYIENIFTPIDSLFLSFSYRRDESTSHEGEDSKRISCSYTIEPTDTKLKWVYGEGFKAPSMYQLNAPASNWGPIGNSNLASEHSKTYEMGFEQPLFDNMKVEFTSFRTYFRNLIDFVSGTGYTNVSKARIYGIEADLDYQFNDNWNFNLGYAWLDTENKENKAQLERRPENKVNFDIRGEFKKWNTHVGFSYVGHRTQGTAGNTLLKPYLLLDASVRYHLNPKLDVFIRGENILDKDYEVVDHYQSKKFSVYLGAKAKF